MARRRNPSPGVALALVAVAAAALLSACSSGGDRSARSSAPPTSDDRVVVASFNFPESVLLADIYADALSAAGIPVRRERDLGPRELVEPALQQHLVDVVPEYLGSALAALEPDARVDKADPAAVRAELARAFAPWGIDVLQPSAAQNQNGFGVTPATASRLGLRSVSDLQPVAGRLAMAGPPECPTRPYCLVGLHDVYGVDFARFLPFETEQQRVTAIDEGVADVALVFTTDAHVATGDVVLLADVRHLEPVENVVPVVSTRALARYGRRLSDSLDGVSAKLTQNGLVFLDWRVGLAGRDPEAEARAWIERQGLAHGA